MSLLKRLLFFSRVKYYKPKSLTHIFMLTSSPLKRLLVPLFLIVCMVSALGLLPHAARAALASSYIVSGAGNSTYNGTYTPNGTSGGVTVFRYYPGSNARFLFWNSTYSTWTLTTIPGNTPPYDYSNPGSNISTIPSSGWIVSNGVAPAPTVTAGATAPVITSISPTSATISSTVTLTGSGFTGATVVSVNGTNASTFSVVSDTSLSFTVPSGATSGTVSVTTSSGTGTSATSLTISPSTTGILSPRSLTLSSSTAGTATNHQFSLTTGTTYSIGSIGLQYCTTASGSCTAPTGLSTTAASLSAQTGATGFTLLSTTNGAPYLTRTAASIPASTALSFTLSNVTNPTSANTPFFVRVTSYAGTDGASGLVDAGTVSSSTGGQLSAYGSIGETLSFCVGTSITGVDCTTASGSSINMGTFSPNTPATGTAVFSAATNGASGYTVSVTGTTLTNPGGTATIPALASQTASAPGTSQFGINVAANTAPSIGAAIAGTGTAVAAATYATPNQFCFVSGDTLASVTGPTLGNTFTVSYLANVSPTQRASTYIANLTFICTPTF